MEMLSYYYRWVGGQLCTHSNWVDSCQTLTPLPFEREFNPFSQTVYIHGSCIYLVDSVPWPGAFHALQRNSDFAMISVRCAATGNASGMQAVPGGPLRLEPTDRILEENGQAPNNLRQYGVTIFYSLAP